LVTDQREGGFQFLGTGAMIVKLPTPACSMSRTVSTTVTPGC